jgi:hypothetical protein
VTKTRNGLAAVSSLARTTSPLTAKFKTYFWEFSSSSISLDWEWTLNKEFEAEPTLTAQCLMGQGIVIVIIK